jgi:hypothetical protein
VCLFAGCGNALPVVEHPVLFITILPPKPRGLLHRNFGRATSRPNSPQRPAASPHRHCVAQELVISNLVRVNTVISQSISKQDEDRTTEFL